MTPSKTREVLWPALPDLPDELGDEVVDFVQFLRLRRHHVPDTAVLSDAALAEKGRLIYGKEDGTGLV